MPEIPNQKRTIKTIITALVGKIVIISIGVIGLLLLLLVMAAACELMANIYTATHKDELNDENDYYDDDDDYQSPFYEIHEIKDYDYGM